MSKIFTQHDLERAATAFIQKHGAGEELEWHWQNHGLLIQFIHELFPQPSPAPDWHAEQAKRWDAIAKQGWKSSLPPKREGQIGLRLQRDGMTVDLYTSADRSQRNIHTSLLNAAEKVIAMRTTAPRG